MSKATELFIKQATEERKEREVKEAVLNDVSEELRKKVRSFLDSLKQTGVDNISTNSEEELIIGGVRRSSLNAVSRRTEELIIKIGCSALNAVSRKHGLGLTFF